MPLLRLPPEVFGQILDHVGPFFFHEDVSRLTVCKQWFSVARITCYKEVSFSPDVLRRLLSSKATTESQRLIRESLETLDVKLQGFDGWDAIEAPQSDLSGDATDLPVSIWSAELGDVTLPTWTTDLNKDLAQLAIVAQGSRRLRTMRIQAFSEGHHRLPHLPHREYLYLSPLLGLLSVRNLAVLDLDLCGTQLVPQPEDDGGGHICTSISALLPTLRRLRLRMRSICPEALRVQQDDDGNIRLALSEVIVNLSLCHESTTIMTTGHSTRCGSIGGGGFLTLMEDIERRAEVLAARMGTSAKIVRVLTHSFPYLELCGVDILTGRRMKLTDSIAWEDEGETLRDEDTDTESEIRDDEFSTFSDE